MFATLFHSSGLPTIRPSRMLMMLVVGLSAGLTVGPTNSGVSRGATIEVDFEGIELTGANASGTYYNGADGAGGFEQQGVLFTNSFTDFGDFEVWSGWAVSRSVDTTTPGFTNEFSAITGGGVRSSGGESPEVDPDSAFGVAYVSQGDPARIDLGQVSRVLGMYVTNTTYAALSMRDGDPFAKKFGGPSGTDPDYFLLTITGWDVDDSATGEVTVALADFRGDAASDSILDSWLWTDLTGLGDKVARLTFEVESSDVGDFGINTPTYFAIDNLRIQTVPEPSACALLLSLVVFVRRRMAFRPVQQV